MDIATTEAVTKVVYGETFGRYNKTEFLDFLRPLEVRLAQNGISPSVFEGKKCLDAGCGGGRGTVLMAKSGAAEVVAYDLNEQNIQTTLRNASLFDLKNVKAVSGSLVSIPFPDNSFDVVWCNGVLHHTVDPDQTLKEVCRVLKPGGHLWLYLYGSGGIYWYMVRILRDFLKDISIPAAVAQLAAMGVPTGRIAEFIDDWYVPVLKTYTDADVRTRLQELGLPEAKLLTGGMSYDTSVRVAEHQEQNWMGEGDLRYWVAKSGKESSQQPHPLPHNNGLGSAYNESNEVLGFKKDFEELTRTIESLEKSFPEIGQSPRLSIAARMQTWLRDRMTEKDEFDGQEFRFWISQEINRIRQFTLPETALKH